MDIDIEIGRPQMMTTTPHFTLNNGVKIPALGLGVLGRETPELVVQAVEKAIATGYRLIDTAASYGNESQVGEGLARAITEDRKINTALLQHPAEIGMHGDDAN